jgi:hypothetical protein
VARERPDEYRDPPPFGFAQGRDDDSSEYGLVVSAFKVGNSERGKARRLGAGLLEVMGSTLFLIAGSGLGWLAASLRCGLGRLAGHRIVGLSRLCALLLV